MQSDGSPWTTRQRVLKRSLDLVIALPALAVTSPIIAVAALAAHVDTKQSGIFAQERIGMHGRLVTIYKIRTMRAGGGTTVTTLADARVTSLGRWLRTFKIDELPQLVNVVRGDMSLVGPRPDVPGFADLLTGDERLLLAVRPGITGPATLEFRHEESLLATVADPDAYNREVVYPAKVKINIAYVRNYSMRMDIRYLAQTLLQVTHREQSTAERGPVAVASTRSN